MADTTLDQRGARLRAWGVHLYTGSGAVLALLASGYGICQAEAKTPDHFFTGFPSYWNVVALYLFVLGWPPWVNAAVLAFFSAMVFVPIRYLYPSRMPTAQKTTYALGALWGLSVFWMLAQFPTPSRALALATLLFPAYYVAVSLWLHLRTPPSPQHVPDYEDEP